jgi:hypothetical protein
VRFSTTISLVFWGGGIIFLLPSRPIFFFSVFGFFFLVVVLFFCSILLRQPCCCPGLLVSVPFWLFVARRSSSSMKQPGSTLVLRWVLKNSQSIYLRSTWAYTLHSIVTTGLSALHRHLAFRRLHYKRRDVSFTRWRVSSTLRAVASSCSLLP